MKVFVLPRPPDADSRVILENEAYHYLVRVRRLGAGHVFTAVTPSGVEGRVLVERIERNRLIGRWEAIPSLRFDEPSIYLFPAVLKGSKLDDVLRAATECGITLWQPWYAKNSIPRDDKPENINRWKKISEQAMMQSGRIAYPEIRLPTQTPVLADEIRRCNTVIVFHHQKHNSEDLHQILCSAPQPIGLVYGPEGGLDDSEIQLFEKQGARFSWLGHAILRSETAILYGLAAVHTIIRETATWKIR